MPKIRRRLTGIRKETNIATLVIALTLAVVYWFPIRRWMGRWGSTSSDLTRVMAGDDVVDPTYSGSPRSSRPTSLSSGIGS
jgi:hypothetical protein